MDDEKVYFQNLLNFSGGPGALPYTVLKEAQSAMVDTPGLGISILGVSHRSEWFADLLHTTKTMLRTLMNIPDNYSVLFLQGGSSLLFSMIPMNFALPQLGEPEYVHSGYWSERAFLEASKVTKCKVLWSGQRGTPCRFVPALDSLEPSRSAAYMHYVSNETVEGLQFDATPPDTDCAVIADMSSDFLSRPVDVSKFAMIYAHAQKNLGPAGVTIAIIRDDLLARCPKTLPDMLNLRVLAEHESLYNTPNVFGIYVLNRMLNWVREAGTEWLFERNRSKAKMLYETLDRYPVIEVFAERQSRSDMNVAFGFTVTSWNRLFLQDLESEGFMGLEGHRSMGAIRASLYNGVTVEAVEGLCYEINRFMRDQSRA